MAVKGIVSHVCLKLARQTARNGFSYSAPAIPDVLAP